MINTPINQIFMSAYYPSLPHSAKLSGVVEHA
jgi:hypothetical protein